MKKICEIVYIFFVYIVLCEHLWANSKRDFFLCLFFGNATSSSSSRCLDITEAQAKIAGPEEVYVKTGSMISLICSVNIHSQPAGSVTWYHGSNIVDFNSPRGGISLETEKTDAGTTSKLVITRANASDSGNYTCVPSNAYQASVWVHVLNGK